MTNPGIRFLDEDKALEMIDKILQSDIDDCYKLCITQFSEENYCEFCFDIAQSLAFCRVRKPLPEEVCEFVLLAYLDAIEEGDEEAMLDLGSLYYTGRIGEQNYAEAVKYYQMAEAKGDLTASENLGYCYYYGRSVEVDYEKAFHYFIKPALAGYTESIYKIGDMYAKGLYVEQDERMAFRLYYKAYDEMGEYCDVEGDVCLRLANCSYYGIGCEVDLDRALRYYQRAEVCYYHQLRNGDFFKRKILDGVIEKINKIRSELIKQIDSEDCYD